MKYDYLANWILGIGIVVVSIFIGRITASTPSTTYNNTQAVTDCAATIERCNEGWSSTLKILRSCRDLLSEEN